LGELLKPSKANKSTSYFLIIYFSNGINLKKSQQFPLALQKSQRKTPEPHSPKLPITRGRTMTKPPAPATLCLFGIQRTLRHPMSFFFAKITPVGGLLALSLSILLVIPLILFPADNSLAIIVHTARLFNLALNLLIQRDQDTGIKRSIMNLGLP
jgi:hypothetical protein